MNIAPAHLNQHSHEPQHPHLEVSPDCPNLDTELRIRLSGLPPGAEVTLRASQSDRGREWQSAATFTAASDGTVDLARDAPVRGSYQQADPMGLVWSMEPADALEPADANGPAGPVVPLLLKLTAEIDGAGVAAVQRHRLRIPVGLCRTDVREDGLVGTLFVPEGGPAPGVLQLGGSEGGMHESDAALLAAHGYAVLALAYYGMPGLPATLRDIPLEYFGRAVRYLQRHDQVIADRLTIIGVSKGGEAALLAGSIYPEIRGVISVVGGGVVTQGISQDVLNGSFLDIMGTPVPNWTYQGQVLPYLANAVTPELERAAKAGEPVALRDGFHPGVLETDQAATATIAVERINGPVLLISGADDQAYGVPHQDVAAGRLASHQHKYPWKHVIYEDAGHLIAAAPYGPTTVSHSPGPGVTFRWGGTPAADARARADGWQEILNFLR